MGSFRSKRVRATDVATLTAADRPTEVRDKHGKVTQAEVTPENWLGEDEWVRYVTKPTHRMSTRLADDGTVPVLDKRGRRVIDVKVRAGTMAQIKLEEGIVDWAMFDETNTAVPWDRTRASELIEGLPTAVRQALIDRIAKGEGDDQADDEDDESENPEDRRGND